MLPRFFLFFAIIGLIALSQGCSLPKTASSNSSRDIFFNLSEFCLAETQDAQTLFTRVDAATDPQQVSAKIQTIVITQDIELTGQKIFGTYKIYIQAPDKMRIETLIPGIDQTVSVVNGNRVSTAQRLTGIRELIPGEPEHQQALFDFYMIHPAFPATQLFESYTFAAPFPGDSKPEAFFYITAFPWKTKWPLMSPVTFKIDRKTLLIAETRSTSFSDGGIYQVQSISKKYRPASADFPILIPTFSDERFDANAMRCQLRKIEINVPLAASLFDPPQDNFK